MCDLEANDLESKMEEILLMMHSEYSLKIRQFNTTGNFNTVSLGKNNTFHGHRVQHSTVIRDIMGPLLAAASHVKCLVCTPMAPEPL